MSLQNIQAVYTTQYQKSKQPNQKVGKGTWRYISPKKTYRSLTSTWKDAQHHSLSEKCKSKLQWDTPHISQNGHHKKSLQTINAGEGVEKREHSYIPGGNVNWYCHYGRGYGNSLKS